MSNKPSSLDKEQAERLSRRSEVLGQTDLSGLLLGEMEVVAGSPRHSRTAARIRIEGDEGTSSTAS
jgi:hypothetical protein